MKRFLGCIALAMLLTTSVGCFLPIYSGDPVRRTRQLLWTSENLRIMADEWERIWFLDQPSHLTPYRYHGGVI